MDWSGFGPPQYLQAFGDLWTGPFLAVVAKKARVDSRWSHGQHISLNKKEVLIEYQWASGPFLVSWWSKICYKSRLSSSSDGFGNSAFLLAVSKPWQPGLEASCSLSWSAGLKLKRKFAKEPNARKAVSGRLDTEFLNCSFKLISLGCDVIYNIVPVSVHSSKLCLQDRTCSWGTVRAERSLIASWSGDGPALDFGFFLRGFQLLPLQFIDLTEARTHSGVHHGWNRPAIRQRVAVRRVVEALGIGATSYQRWVRKECFFILSSVVLHPFCMLLSACFPSATGNLKSWKLQIHIGIIFCILPLVPHGCYQVRA